MKFTTGELILADTLTAQRFRSLLIGLFAGIALLLAAIGLYSVLAYGVAHARQRSACAWLSAHGAVRFSR